MGNATILTPLKKRKKKPRFFVFHIDFGDNFLLLAINCVRDESCREKLAPISPRDPKFVAQTDFCVHR